MMEADIEPVARAIYFAASGEERPDFDRQPASVKRFYFKQAAAAIAAWNLRAERWREGIEAAMKLMDQIGCDWRDAGDMTKFYATNYLIEAIRALHPSVAEGRGDNSVDAAASPIDHNKQE